MSLLVSLREQYRTFEQKIKFFRHHGYRLDLKSPRSFNEKIIWRKIFDRNPLFPIIMDKKQARDYVKSKLGKETGERILVPLIFDSENPEEIPFGELPEEYILKPNHGSGWSIIVDRDHPAQPGEIVSKCRRWMKKTYGRSKMEWAYSSIAPRIMVEKLLKDSQGDLVPDFKFHVFGGKVEWVFVMHDRFGSRSAARYLRDFTRMESASTSYTRAKSTPKPENFEEMVEIVEKLAKDLDYIRVDMYNVDGAVFFGEFTIYPASGLNRMGKAMDLGMGEKWDLDRRYARNFRPWF